MVVLEILAVSVIALMCGGIVSYIISKKTKVFDNFDKLEKQKKEFSKNPQKLIDALNKNGPIVDMGEDIIYELKNGVVVENRTPHKEKPKLSKDNSKRKKVVKKVVANVITQ